MGRVRRRTSTKQRSIMLVVRLTPSRFYTKEFTSPTMWSPQSEKFLLEQSRKFLLTRGQETECQRNRRRSIRRNGTGCTRPSVNRSHRESNAVWDKVMCGLFDPQLWGGGEGIPASVRGGEIGGERELHCRQPGKTASIAGTAPG